MESTELQWLPISKYMIDDIFNSPEKSMKLHHLLCSFVPGGQSISQSPVIQRRQRWGLFLRLPILYPLPTSLRRRWVTSLMSPFSHFEGRGWCRRAVLCWKPTFQWFSGPGVSRRVAGERSQADWTPGGWPAAMLLPHQLLCFKAVFKEFLHWRGIGECEVRLFGFSSSCWQFATVAFYPGTFSFRAHPSLCTSKSIYYVGMC